jgi:hypothetical protein
MKNNIHKCLLIDPYTQTISPIDIIEDDIRSIQDAIGCRIFCVGGYLANGDCVYVDDEGSLESPTHFFRMPNVNGGRELAGRGLVIGTGSEGSSASTESTIEELYDAVYWRFAISADRDSVFEIKARDEWTKTDEEVAV